MRRAPWLLLLLAIIGCGGPPNDAAEQIGSGSTTNEAPTVEQLVGFVRVWKDGFHRIDEDSLERLGVPDRRHLQVVREGEAVPLDDTFVFLASGVGSDGTASDVYELWVRPDDVASGEDGPPTVAELVRTLADDRVFGDVAGAEAAVYAADVPTWYLARIERGQGTSILLGPLGAEHGSEQVLEVDLVPTHLGDVVVEADWGGHLLGRASTKIDATTGRAAPLRFDVPANVVPTEDVALVLRDVTTTLPPASRNDVTHGRGRIFVDRLTLLGPGRLDGGSVRDARTVEAQPIPTLSGALDGALEAEHVILATPPLLPQSERLAAHRTAMGTPSIAIPVVDVYWRDGGGEHTARAIHRAVKRWETFGRLRYLLLAGDATLDRTDLVEAVTIPAPMARTMYNGATASDRLFVRSAKGPHTGGPAIGRLPFRTADEMRAYVDRVIAYETRPPAHPTRRLMRFVTSEGRFGAIADTMIENLFKQVVADSIPAVYDVEITNASASSVFLWPPRELNDKVVAGINEGALFYTYVGHGFEQGFDTLRVGKDRFRILHKDDVPRISVVGTPPTLFVIACTTAVYDLPSRTGIGEALLARPDGPIAYWGATRVCHPAANSLVGVELARRMARGDGRLGDIIRDAWDSVLEPPPGNDPVRNAIRLGVTLAAGKVDIPRLALEGRWMYVLLGDPALRVAFPREDIRVRATHDAADEAGLADIEVELEGSLPDGADIVVSLEVSRDKRAHAPHPVGDVRDPRSAAVIRQNHALMNDWSIARRVVRFDADRARLVFPRQPVGKRLYVKAYVVTADDVHHGAAQVELR